MEPQRDIMIRRKGVQLKDQGGGNVFRKELCTVLSTKTFLLIMAQGFFGSIPWNAFAFMVLNSHTFRELTALKVMWFQYLGFSDFQASFLYSGIAAGSMLGGILGGVLGDVAAQR